MGGLFPSSPRPTPPAPSPPPMPTAAPVAIRQSAKGVADVASRRRRLLANTFKTTRLGGGTSGTVGTKTLLGS
mgnify:CR=1 FL=1